MSEIRFSYHVLRAALVRGGTWIVNSHGFVHTFVCHAHARTVPEIHAVMESRNVL